MINTEVLKLRKELHQNPELSGKEFNTAKRIKDFIAPHNPSQLFENVGGSGLIAVFEYANPGATITIRCELDALPIEEENTFNHQSKVKGVSHKCGHDGHMAIVAGLVYWIKKQSFHSGKIVLLFQPAEETGKGAHAVMNDERFKKLNPDYLFALHNIPGAPLNSIIAMSPYPFKFGEDFGWFSKEYKTAMFGLGAGINSPSLHHADYDFPDEIIETGIRMFASLIEHVLTQPK